MSPHRNSALIVLLLPAIVALPACGRARLKPEAAQVEALTLSQAHRQLRETAPLADRAGGGEFTFTDLGFVARFRDGEVVKTRYADTPEPILSSHSGSYVVWATGESTRRTRCCYWYWNGTQKAVALRFQAAFARLAKGWQERPEDAAAFEAVAKEYRAATVKPPFPEDARRARVGAEAALAEKRIDDAADRYAEALAVAPWWPEGHFNRALVLGELGRYAEAIGEMKRYLMLVPEAANARQAQDQVYKWEDKLASAMAASR